MKKLLAIIVLSLLWSGKVSAEVYNAKSFNCTYYHTSNAQIKGDKYKVENEKNIFEFSIVNIDLDTKKSLLVGNSGTDELTLINTRQSGMHFIQIMPVGNMTMTTVYPEEISTNKLGQKLYASSHSRHIAMINKSLPQQFYGHCAKTG